MSRRFDSRVCQLERLGNLTMMTAVAWGLYIIFGAR